MNTKGKTITATEFKAKCLRILDELEPQGVVILKRGRPVARVTPLSGRKNELAISGVVLWELAKLIQLGRLDLDLESAAFRQCLRQVHTFPITLEIARTSTQLDFASDPADEIIAATSIVERIPLLTRDRRILKSRVVPLAR